MGLLSVPGMGLAENLLDKVRVISINVTALKAV